MSLLLWLPFGMLALCATRVSGQTPQQLLMAPLPLDTAVRHGQLENGMTYYIRANAKPKDRAEFYIVHHVGAILEEDEQDGLAHFTEHMAFNGTKHFPGKQLLNFLEHNGVKFGADVNAFTTQDMTCYNVSDVPTTRKGLLDSCVQVLCDWSGDILFEPAEIDAEREVIAEEWRTRRNAGWRLNEAKTKVLARGSKYAERDVIGPLTLIKTFDHKVLKDFYHKWYRPEFQAIVIVGDFDVNEMEARVKKMAGQLPKRSDKIEKPSFPLQPSEGVDFGSHTDPEAQIHRIEIIYKHPATSKEPKNVNFMRRGLIRNLVEQMLNARFNELSQQPEKPFIAGIASYGNLVEPNDGFYLVGVGTPGQLQQTLKGIITESQRARQNGFTEGELARAKANLQRAVQSEFDERGKQNNMYYVWQYISNFISGEPAPPIELKMQLTQLLLETITVEETKAMLQELMPGRDVVIFASGPDSEKADIPSEAQVEKLFNAIYDSTLDPWVDNTKEEPLVAETPTPGRITSKKQNKKFGTTEWKLSNGIHVILKPTDFKDDEVMLRGVAPGGMSLVETKDLPSAMMAGQIMDYCGMGNFDATELKKALAGKDVGVGASIGRYSTNIMGSSSAKIEELEMLFQLVYLSFTQPRFEEKGFNTLMDMLRTVFANRDKDPNFIFRKALFAALSNNSPRGRELDSEMLEKISLERAAKIYSERFASAQNFTFVITGNIDPEQLKPLVETYLGSLPRGVKEHWRDDGLRPLKGTLRKEFAQKMQTAKSRAALVFVGKAKNSLENQVACEALQHVLDLRCIEEVREEQGGTYGVSTMVSINEKPEEWSQMLFLFDTDPEKLDSLIPILEDIFRNTMHNISQNDVEKTKKHMLKAHEEALKSNRYWLNMLTDYEQTGIDMHTKYEKCVEDLSPEALQKASKSLFAKSKRLDLYMRGYTPKE